MSKSSERVKRWRKRTKERLVEAFGGKCGCCGYEGPSCVMDFHHLDPNEKELGLGAVRGNLKSWEKIVNEIRKCVMLCSNCHREHHGGYRDIPADAPRFNEEYADYKKKARDEVWTPCAVCNEPKPSHLITCSSKCAAKRSRKIDWDTYDKLLKEELFNKTPFTKIAEKIGNISDVAVRKRAKKLNLI